MLGHGSATMTLDTHGHLFDDRLDEVGDAMDRARTERAHGNKARPLLPTTIRCCPVLP
jgi:hypothetical protein